MGYSPIKEEEVMDMYGIEYRNEYLYRCKTKEENKDLIEIIISRLHSN
ncbi:hypothetical protein ACWGOQ_0021650 [Aquimarina sp. M1]